MDGGDTASNLADGGAHGFHVGTNASSGLVTTVWGETLTGVGGDTITAIGATAAASAVGTEQFGLCLAVDTTGTYPTDASDTGDALPDAVIGDADFDCAGTSTAMVG